MLLSWESGDVEQDYTAVKGEDLLVAFQLTPLDLTGCTAVMSVTGLADFTMALEPLQFGAFSKGSLALSVAASVTAGWLEGLYPYRIRVTFPDGAVRPFGHGTLQVRS